MAKSDDNNNAALQRMGLTSQFPMMQQPRPGFGGVGDRLAGRNPPPLQLQGQGGMPPGLVASMGGGMQSMIPSILNRFGAMNSMMPGNIQDILMQLFGQRQGGMNPPGMGMPKLPGRTDRSSGLPINSPGFGGNIANGPPMAPPMMWQQGDAPLSLMGSSPEINPNGGGGMPLFSPSQRQYSGGGGGNIA